MNTCKDCLCWKDVHTVEDGFLVGLCDSPKIKYGIMTEKDRASPNDCEGYHASFETGEDFGCVHWKQK